MTTTYQIHQQPNQLRRPFNRPSQPLNQLFQTVNKLFTPLNKRNQPLNQINRPINQAGLFPARPQDLLAGNSRSHRKSLWISLHDFIIQESLGLQII